MTKATTPVATVQQIIQQQQHIHSNPHVQHVMSQLAQCRTAKLGYHTYQCADQQCAQIKYQYHSCRNRHCPQCGALQKEQWIEDRKRELLPIAYYHVVFTLPHELNSLILGNRKQLFKLLFDASAKTIQCFAKDKKYLNAQPGFLSVLHTWGQQLSFHPHVHCIVSGGGIASQNGKLIWKNGTRLKDNFLFPVKAMSIVYRAKFLQMLAKLIEDKEVQIPNDFNQKIFFNNLYKKEWVVYAKKPFGGPEQVIEYLGRYTHKVAITNHRIKAIDAETKTVTFDYKDYADHGKQKQMTISMHEFIRRFEQHILPKGLTKIRSYGYLANQGRAQRIQAITQLLNIPPHPQKVIIPWQVRLLERYGITQNQCPTCKQNTLVLIQQIMKPIDDS
jgi:hypothetical protein